MTKRLTYHYYLDIISILVLLFTTSIQLISQSDSTNFDTKGKDFWLCFPPNYHTGKTNPTVLYDDSLYIFITADMQTSGTIEYFGLDGKLIISRFDIADTSQIYKFSVFYENYELLGYNDNSKSLWNRNNSEVITKQYFHIVSDNEVTVYAHNQAYTSSDACLVFPTDVLGNDYFVMTYNSDGWMDMDSLDEKSTPSQFVILATEDNTNVRIIPKTETQYNGLSMQNLILNKGESYLVQARITIDALRNDLTGSEVISNKPVAVFAGHQRSTLPNRSNYANPTRDYLLEQMPPVKTWGKNALLVPYQQPVYITKYGSDIFRIIASGDSTNIFINSVLVDKLNKGEFYEGDLIDASYLTANNPILAAQFKKTSDINGTIPNSVGDPFEMLIPPVEQFMTDYRVLNTQTWQESSSQNVYDEQYITIVVPDSAISKVIKDGYPIPANNFTPIPNSGYYYTNYRVTDGVHSINCQSKIGVYVYGYGHANSYGYVGGMSMERLYSDNKRPKIYVYSDSCNKETNIVVSDTMDYDSGLLSFQIIDTVNCQITTENYAPKYIKVKINVIDQNKDAIYHLKATDSAGLETDIIDTIQGFTITFQGLSDIENTFKFDSTLIGEMNCKTISVSNSGLLPFTFDENMYLKKNIIFSMPGFQLPFIISPGETKNLTICFSPVLAGDSPLYDTLLFGFNCLNKELIVEGKVKPGIEILRSDNPCTIPLKITLKEIPGNKLFELSYPNSSVDNITIRFGLTEVDNVSLKVYDLYGNLRQKVFTDKLAPGIYELPISTENLEAGIYFCSLEAGNKALISKMLISK